MHIEPANSADASHDPVDIDVNVDLWTDDQGSSTNLLRSRI